MAFIKLYHETRKNRNGQKKGATMTIPELSRLLRMRRAAIGFIGGLFILIETAGAQGVGFQGRRKYISMALSGTNP
jgi:hypothetical protein